jgi:hypothetical protein
MEIVIMHCYETVLKSNNFKKHVFTSATDQSMSRIALYEYLGTYDLPSTDTDSQTGSFSKATFPVEVIDVKTNI